MSSLARGRRLRPRDLALLPLAGGVWLRRTHLSPVPVHQAGHLEDVLVGIYLVTDASDHIVWLGQALRDGGVAGRLRDHVRRPERAALFHQVRALQLDDFTPVPAVSAVEGRAADLLGIRGRLGVRSWPSAEAWPELCTRPGGPAAATDGSC